jgi:hypothetical protein
VTVDLSYARVGDMNLVLKHLDTNTTVTLIITPAGPGGIGTCNGSDMLVTLDDSATNFADDECAAARPTIKGAFKPSQALSKFKGEQLAGTWRISVEDAEGQGHRQPVPLVPTGAEVELVESHPRDSFE